MWKGLNQECPKNAAPIITRENKIPQKIPFGEDFATAADS